MNAVTGSGAPSKTSGAHVWNGTRLNLKTSPIKNMPAPIQKSGLDAKRRIDEIGERNAAGRTEEQRHAEEQESRRRRAQNQILHGRFARRFSVDRAAEA